MGKSLHLSVACLLEVTQKMAHPIPAYIEVTPPPFEPVCIAKKIPERSFISYTLAFLSEFFIFNLQQSSLLVHPFILTYQCFHIGSLGLRLRVVNFFQCFLICKARKRIINITSSGLYQNSCKQLAVELEEAPPFHESNPSQKCLSYVEPSE